MPRIRMVFLITTALLFLLLVAVPGCAREATPENQPPEHEEPLTPPTPEKEEPQTPEPTPGEPQTPAPTTGDDNPSLEPQELALRTTEIRSLELEPTVHDIGVCSSRYYISYYLPANVEVLRLTDLFGADYPLPTPEGVLPTMEGAVWWGNKLYYLSRDGWFSDEPMEPTLFVYDTSTHSADDYQLNFPDEFSPHCFFVSRGEVLLVSETGAYKYSLDTKSLEKAADFYLDQEFLARAVLNPWDPLLAYPDGNQVKVLDVRTGEESVMYQAEGEISEICWDRFGDSIAMLIDNRLEIIGQNGSLLYSRIVCEGAHSLGWVPLLEKVCYLVPEEGNTLPKLVIEDFEECMRFTHPGCSGYTWSGVNKLWTYWESPERDATILVNSYVHWNPDQEPWEPHIDEASRQELPKLPVTHAQGDFVTIAEDLFIMSMEKLKSEQEIIDYKLHYVGFHMEETWGFQAYVSYSVQSDGDDWVSGDGEIGEDGWVNGKECYIWIYRDQDFYIYLGGSSHPSL